MVRGLSELGGSQRLLRFQDSALNIRRPIKMRDGEVRGSPVKCKASAAVQLLNDSLPAAISANRDCRSEG